MLRTRLYFAYLVAILCFPLTSACGGEATESTELMPSGGASELPGSGGEVGAGGTVSSGGEQAAGGAFTGGTGGGDGGADGGSNSGGSGGGDASGGAGTGGSAAECGVFRSAPRAASSAGFSGTDAQYSELYSQPCSVPADCVAPCEARGGTDWFCEFHVCVDSEQDYCLPQTKWRGLGGALVPSGSSSNAAETSLSTVNGPVQDRLKLQDFDFNLPPDSVITGVSVEVARMSETSAVRDYSVRLLKGGVEVGSNRGTTDLWSDGAFETVEYGGESDLWGESWTAADFNSTDFGLAVGALPAGGGRAYIDIAYVTVHTQCPIPH